MGFFFVRQFNHVLRDLVPNTVVADHARQQVHISSVLLSRVAALLRYKSFYSGIVETVVSSTLFPTGGAGSKVYRFIILLQPNGRKCCQMGLHCCFDFVQWLEANQTTHRQYLDHGKKT